MNRRNFLQLSLVAACASPLRAAPSAEHSLRARFTSVWTSQGLAVTVVVDNVGSRSVDVLWEIGNRSALQLQARLPGETIVARPDPTLAETPMTRAGPRRVWAPIPPGGHLKAAPLYFDLSRHAVTEGAVLTIRLETPGGRVSLQEPFPIPH